MANIQERRDKNGKLISYSVRVHRGRGADGKQLKPWTATFEVRPTWTEKSARKKAEAFAATFEKECKEGTATDTRLKFSEYTNYVLDLKEKRDQIKHSTLVRYKELCLCFGVFLISSLYFLIILFHLHKKSAISKLCTRIKPGLYACFLTICFFSNFIFQQDEIA